MIWLPHHSKPIPEPQLYTLVVEDYLKAIWMLEQNETPVSTARVAEMADIERLRDSMRASGVEFLLVSPEDPEPVELFRKRYGYDLPILLEVEKMPEAFGLQALPTTFVVDRAGRIVLKHRGAAEWDQDAVRVFLRSLTG